MRGAGWGWGAFPQGSRGRPWSSSQPVCRPRGRCGTEDMGPVATVARPAAGTSGTSGLPRETFENVCMCVAQRGSPEVQAKEGPGTAASLAGARMAGLSRQGPGAARGPAGGLRPCFVPQARAARSCEQAPARPSWPCPPGPSPGPSRHVSPSGPHGVLSGCLGSSPQRASGTHRPAGSRRSRVPLDDHRGSAQATGHLALPGSPLLALCTAWEPPHPPGALRTEGSIPQPGSWQEASTVGARPWLAQSGGLRSGPPGSVGPSYRSAREGVGGLSAGAPRAPSLPAASATPSAVPGLTAFLHCTARAPCLCSPHLSLQGSAVPGRWIQTCFVQRGN